MTTRRTFLQTTALGIAGSAFAQTPSPASPIDFHAHWIGPHVVELLGKRSSPRPPQGQGWFDIDARLRQMDEAGVQRQVLSYVGASYDGVMPNFSLSDHDIAAVLSYVRSNFGNAGGTVSPQDVQRVRTVLADVHEGEPRPVANDPR